MTNGRSIPAPLAMLMATLLITARAASAQTTTAVEPFAITDNSFFVEEAFNQERGIFQNILVWQKVRDGGWDGSFTQEFPAPAMRHQLSYTLTFGSGVIGSHLGGVLLNYRLQAREETASGPAVSPRFSVLLPVERGEEAEGNVGIQVNLPVSKQFHDVYVHANVGFTQLFNVPVGADETTLTTPVLAGSAIYRLTPMFNLMIEGVVVFAQYVDGTTTAREQSVTMSPGFRTGWNLGEKQLVVGVAVPVTTVGGESTIAALGYLSYELPFRANH